MTITSRSIRVAAFVALILSIGFIAAATLTPIGNVRTEYLSLCLVCGNAGLSDVFANVLLFVPLGAAGALLVGGRWWVVAAAALFSGSIEGAQFLVPGRFPAVGDVVTNTLGALTGVGLARWHRHFLFPTPALAGRLALGAAGLATVIMTLTGYAFTPVFPESRYFVMWTPRLEHLHPYDGAVTEAVLGGRDAPAALTPWVRERLLAGASWKITAVKGSPPPGRAPLLAIYDDSQREILLLGARGEDMVLRQRLRAADMRLEQPSIIAEDMLETAAVGSVMRIEQWRDRAGHCLSVNGIASCGLGFSVGRGWSLVNYVESLPPLVHRLLDAVWVGALLLPLGFWISRGWESAGAVLLAAAALVAVPGMTDLLPTPPVAWLAGGIGVGVGLLLRRLAGRCVGTGGGCSGG